MQQTYPTPWQLGKPRGSIKEQPTCYLVVMSFPDLTQTNTYFRFKENNNDKQATLQKAEEFRYAESARHGMTRNQIRYIDANTIEVILTQDCIMQTDANLLQFVEKYPLNIKTKKEKTAIRHYVMCQDKKRVFQFTDLICNYKIVEYINGDTLDLKLENLKEFGSISNNNKNLIINKNVIIDEYDIKNQYTYSNMEINKLPKNIWLLGRPAGTIFKRNGENIYTVRVNDDDNVQHTKTFNINEYPSDEAAYKIAKQWQIEISYALGTTKNLIKILDNDIIAVQLTKNQVMKTNKIFIPLLQKILVCAGTSGNGDVYAIVSINNINIKFHKFITGFNMVDHINGDRLNNCLENLRNIDHYLNNKNIHYTDNTNMKDINLKTIQNNKYYVAKIKLNGVSYEKHFDVNAHGEESAKELAKNFREKFYAAVKFEQTITQNDEPQLINIELIKTKYIYNLAIKGIIFNKNKYLTNASLTETELKNIHDYYISHQLRYTYWLNNEDIRISEILANIQQ
jgi:hypothetical protein